MALELRMMLRVDRHGTQRRQRHESNKDMEEKMFRRKELYQMQVERPSQMGSGPDEVKDGGCGEVGDTSAEWKALEL